MNARTTLSDVIVVGGGIVGTAAAAFLADAGVHVTLIEREGLASGASGANSGIVQHPFDPAYEALYHETVALYRELSGLGLGFRLPDAPAGMLFLSPDEEVVRRQAAGIGQAFAKLRTDVVGGADLQALEPVLAADLWACRVDIGYPVVPGASTYAYATLAESRGVAIRQGHAAVPALRDGAVEGVLVDGRPMAADAVLIAAGPWSSELLDSGGAWRPIRPRWGVVVEAVLAEPPRHILEQAGIEAVLGGDESAEMDFSLVPVAAPEGSAVGSTFLASEPDPARWIERLLENASRFVPSVADAPIRGVRACARPQSVDGRPLLGPVPGVEGLFVCAGHGPWGISTGPASARLVVDVILGRGSAIPTELDAARLAPLE